MFCQKNYCVNYARRLVYAPALPLLWSYIVKISIISIPEYSLTPPPALFVSSLFPHTSPLITNHLHLIPTPYPPLPLPFPPSLPHSSSLLHIIPSSPSLAHSPSLPPFSPPSCLNSPFPDPPSSPLAPPHKPPSLTPPPSYLSYLSSHPLSPSWDPPS